MRKRIAVILTVLAILAPAFAVAAPASAVGTGFTVTGHVYGQTANGIVPLQYATVGVLPRERVTGNPGFGSTDFYGEYTLHDVAPGTYLLNFWVLNDYQPPGSSFVSVYYGNTPFEREAISITVSASMSGVDAVLPMGGIVSGTVSIDPAIPRSFDAVEVTVASIDPATGQLFYPGQNQPNRSFVAADGTYSVSGIMPGQAVVRFSDGRYELKTTTQYYDRSAWLFESTPIEIRPGITAAGIDGAVGVGAPRVARISGADRFEMAVNVSRQGFPDGSPPVDVVYIVNGLNYPDALSAGPVASFQGGPLLLVTPQGVPEAVKNELTRLRPAKIVIVGGPNSVSEAVGQDLAAFAPVTRIGGASRYEVSRALIRRTYVAGAPTVFVVTGEKFPDALSTGARAGGMGMPVLLVPPGGLDQPTRQLLLDLGTRKVVIVGGTNSVSDSFRDSIDAIQSIRLASRIDGADRFEVGAFVGASNVMSDTVLLANGLGFADALSGTWLAAAYGAPIILVTPQCIPAVAAQALRSAKPHEVILLGGPASLLPDIETLPECT